MRTMLHCYWDDDDKFYTVWTDDKTVIRHSDGSITLPNGKRAWRNDGMPKPKFKARDDRASVAMACLPGEARKTWEEDKHINGYSAPDYYDKGGVPHWRGDSLNTRRRMRQYCAERGLRKLDEYQ